MGVAEKKAKRAAEEEINKEVAKLAEKVGGTFSLTLDVADELDTNCISIGQDVSRSIIRKLSGFADDEDYKEEIAQITAFEISMQADDGSRGSFSLENNIFKITTISNKGGLGGSPSDHEAIQNLFKKPDK